MSDETETALTLMRGLYGTGSPQRTAATTGDLRRTSDTPLRTGDWDGAGKDGYDQRSTKNRRNGRRLADTDDNLPPKVNRSADDTQRGRRKLDNTKSSYTQGRDALAPVSNTSTGQAALLGLKTGKLIEGSNQVTSDQQQQQQRAAQVRAYMTQELTRLSQVSQQATAQQLSMLGRLAATSASTPTTTIPTTTVPTTTPITTTPTTTTPSTTGSPSSTNRTPGSTATIKGGSRAGAKIAEIALKQLGKPYVWGGGGKNGPTGGGFDCSSLAQYSTYQATGVELPRTTYDQINKGVPVAVGNAQPGDLVFSNFSSPGVPEHVQIALGGGKVVEAPQPGGHVQVSNMPAGAVVKRVVE